jgi:hypothetical protein
MPSDTPNQTRPPGAPPDGPDYGYHGYGGVPPYPPFGMPFPFFGPPPFGPPMPGAQPGPPDSQQPPSYAFVFETMRQLFISRADFWAHLMQAMAQMATHAAGIATEARKASEMMGPGGANLFAPPGGPYTKPASGDVDLEKLKLSLHNLDEAEVAKVLYAVQLVQSLDAARRSFAASGAANQKDW